ncbi:MAG: glutathione S-transferase, partial [Proteobacteria bacterium]|nr:glutathione S-transferase [Pseudomonadota bacterium]
VEKLLRIAGEFYFPFLLANAGAFEAGEKEFSFEAGGMPYSQGVFKYQIKCLAALRRSYAELSQSAKNELSDVLRKTGCLAHLQSDAG